MKFESVISHFELSLIWPASRRATLRIKYKTKSSGSPLSQVEIRGNITSKFLSWRSDVGHPLSVDKEDFDSGLVGGRGGHHCQKWRGSAAQSAQQTTAHLLNRTTWILLGRGKELNDRYIKQTNNKMSQRNLYPKQKTAKNYVLKVINKNKLVNNIVKVHCALFSPYFCEYQVCFCRY